MVQFTRSVERGDDLVHYWVHLRPRWGAPQNRRQNPLEHQTPVKNSAVVAVVEESENRPNSSVTDNSRKVAVEFSQPEDLSGY